MIKHDSLIIDQKMRFNSSKVSFGRHETFPLRYSWLSKGFQAISKNQNIFESDEATIELGVGKNMVISMRYWLRACCMVDSMDSKPTDLGRLILDPSIGLDPYLEDEATIWLIHWLIATNAQLATSFYWFFNKFHKAEFTSEELATALFDFTRENIIENKRPSAATIKNDSQILHRMYTQSRGNNRTPLEDALDSPLALLRLVNQTAGGRGFQSKPEARAELPIGVLGFAVIQLLEARQLKSIPIEELMFSKGDFPALGSIFRLTENDLVTKLEQLVDYIPGVFEVRETAGMHQFYFQHEVSSQDYLIKHYSDVRQREVA